MSLYGITSHGLEFIARRLTFFPCLIPNRRLWNVKHDVLFYGHFGLNRFVMYTYI